MQVLRIFGASTAAIFIVAASPFKPLCQEVELGSLRSGMRVRVQQKGQDPVIGTLTEILKDTIVYQPGMSRVVVLRPLAPSVVNVPISSIERLEVSIGSSPDTSHSISEGIRNGAMAGAASSNVCLLAIGNPCDPNAGRGQRAVAGAVLGGLSRAIGGAKRTTERWQRVRLDRPHGT